MNRKRSSQHAWRRMRNQDISEAATNKSRARRLTTTSVKNLSEDQRFYLEQHNSNVALDDPITLVD
ncbi:MAG: hypothetical protein QM808_11640 [Steroidobacteraceae bacterium]